MFLDHLVSEAYESFPGHHTLDCTRRLSTAQKPQGRGLPIRGFEGNAVRQMNVEAGWIESRHLLIDRNATGVC